MCPFLHFAEFYGFDVTDDNDGIYKKTQETLNLTLRYNKSWKDLTQSKSSCILNMPDLNDDTFENTLQVILYILLLKNSNLKKL